MKNTVRFLLSVSVSVFVWSAQWQSTWARGAATALDKAKELAHVNPVEALDLLHDFNRKHPDIADGHGLAALIHDDRTEDDSALAEINQALKLCPNSADYLAIRAKILMHSGDYRKSANDAKAALKINRKLIDAYELLSDDLYELKDYNEGIRILNNQQMMITQLHLPSRPTLYMRRAKAEALLGRNATAIADFDKAESLGFDSLAMYRVRSQCYQRLGKYDQALSDCTKCVKLQPLVAGHYEARAQLYELCGKKELAQKDRAFAESLTKDILPQHRPGD